MDGETSNVRTLDQMKTKNASQKEMTEPFATPGHRLGGQKDEITPKITSKANAGQDVHQQTKPGSGEH